MDGKKLKETLDRHGWTGKKLGEAMERAPRSVYEWFSKDEIKPALLNEISRVTGIAIEELTVKEEPERDESYQGKGLSLNHGFNVKNTLRQKGISLEFFAGKMGVSRATVYARMKEKKWSTGDLLQAAEILQVPVAQLKGKGEGQPAFEKDIYESLQRIEDMLSRLLAERR